MVVIPFDFLGMYPTAFVGNVRMWYVMKYVRRKLSLSIRDAVDTGAVGAVAPVNFDSEGQIAPMDLRM